MDPLSLPSAASALRRSCLAWLVAQSTAAIQAVALPSYLAVVELFRVTRPMTNDQCQSSSWLVNGAKPQNSAFYRQRFVVGN